MTTAYAPDLAPAPAGRLLRRLLTDSAYVLTGFPLAVVTLVVGTTLFSVGVGLVVVWVGLPVLAAALLSARGFAALERRRIAPVLGRRLPGPVRRPAGPGLRRRMLAPLADGQSWLDLLHGVLRLIPATLGFSVVLSWWAVALGGLAYPLYDWALPHPQDNVELPELLGLGDTAAVRIWFNVALGAVFAVTLLPVVRGAALLEASFARLLLGGVSALREQVVEARAERDEAQAQTAAAVSAEAVALRRLERDIHDGPQQRLVRLAMDLGRAQQQFDADPQAARATVAEALAQTRETLDELRALSRGIAPPILVDRGLRAALTALAGRSTVPVDLDVAPLDRLDPAVESTAYFVVAEALTNVAKHSRATGCQVGLHRSGASLFVTVADDGAGGAALAKGHGLAGLADRVRAAGGVLTVESPEGLGTRVTAALPLHP